MSFHSMSSGMGAMHSNSISNCAGGTRQFAVRSAARVGANRSAVEGRMLEDSGAVHGAGGQQRAAAHLEGVLESGRVVEHRNIRDRNARHPSSPNTQQLKLKRDGSSVARKRAQAESKAVLAHAHSGMGGWEAGCAGRAYTRMHEARAARRTRRSLSTATMSLGRRAKVKRLREAQRGCVRNFWGAAAAATELLSARPAPQPVPTARVRRRQLLPARRGAQPVRAARVRRRQLLCPHG